MTECLALDLAKLSPRLARLIEVKAREWDCPPEVAAMRLLDQAASGVTQPQQAADGADSHLPSRILPFYPSSHPHLETMKIHSPSCNQRYDVRE